MTGEKQSADAVIASAAERMKGMSEFRPPEWAGFVKTGTHKQRPPEQKDWWFIRSAAVLHKISVRGSIGTSRLRKEYGGRKNKGHKPEHKYSGSGAVIRKVLQQLEAAGFVAKDKNRGRKITPKGASFLAEGKGSKEKSK